MPTSELQAAATAYLHNIDNRGIFERSRYFAEMAGDRTQDPDAALAFLLSRTFREEAERELKEIAPKWERHLGRSPARVLDAGSGPGVTTLAMARRYPGAEVIGIDVEPHALTFARALAADMPRCTLVEAPIEDFDPGSGFDLVQCRCVIEHVYDPRVAVARLSRMLRPGGVAYCEFPNYLWPWEPHVKLPMLPKSPKWLLALECRLAGRDPGFIGHLNFQCDPVSFRRWVAAAPEPLQIIDLMREKVQDIFAGDIEPVVESRAHIVSWLRRRPRLSAAALRALTALPLAPSVMVVLRKPQR